MNSITSKHLNLLQNYRSKEINWGHNENVSLLNDILLVVTNDSALPMIKSIDKLETLKLIAGAHLDGKMEEFSKSWIGHRDELEKYLGKEPNLKVESMLRGLGYRYDRETNYNPVLEFYYFIIGKPYICCYPRGQEIIVRITYYPLLLSEFYAVTREIFMIGGKMYGVQFKGETSKLDILYPDVKVEHTFGSYSNGYTVLNYKIQTK